MHYRPELDFTLILTWLIGLIVVAVIVIAIQALRRMLAREAVEPPEMALDKRYAAGELSTRQYMNERDKLLGRSSSHRSCSLQS